MAIRHIQTRTSESWDVRLDPQVTGLELVVPDAELLIDGTAYPFEETRHTVEPDPEDVVCVQGHLCLDRDADTAVFLVEEGPIGDFVQYDFPEEDPYQPVVKYVLLMRVPPGAVSLEDLDYEVRSLKPDSSEEGGQD